VDLFCSPADVFKNRPKSCSLVKTFPQPSLALLEGVRDPLNPSLHHYRQKPGTDTNPDEHTSWCTANDQVMGLPNHLPVLVLREALEPVPLACSSFYPFRISHFLAQADTHLLLSPLLSLHDIRFSYARRFCHSRRNRRHRLPPFVLVRYKM